MIKPALKDDALLADINAAESDAQMFHLWWLGQSGFLVKWQDKHLLIDPYLSDSLTTKYADTDKPHVRMTQLCIAPQRLDFIDLVTSSHNHTDHLDGETLVPLLKANKDLTVVVPAANREFAAKRLNISTDRLTTVDADSSIEAAGFTIHAIPAAHETIQRDKQGRCHFLGYVVQFGPFTIYHSGDTLFYDTMVDRLKKWPIDVAILPINGRAPERRVAGNLWGREAAQLAKDIEAKLLIPCHYDMFDFNTATPVEFTAEAARLKQECKVLKCGERWSSNGLTGIT